MEVQFNSFTEHTDPSTGFRCRSVYANTENFVMHNHDYYEVFFTMSDNITHYVNGKKFILKNNTLVFIRKDDAHYYLKPSSSSLAFINIAFTEDALKELFVFLTDAFNSEILLNEKFPPAVVLTELDKEWLLHQITKLNSIDILDTAAIKYQSRILLFQIFTKFFSRFIRELKFEEKDIPIWLYELDRKMQRLENFSKGAEHMVELSAKTRAHLGRTMRKYYNKTIPEYINDLRLNYIANTLINTDIPILDICYDCGFENISWAYSLFKQKYGMSPLKFRTHGTKSTF